MNDLPESAIKALRMLTRLTLRLAELDAIVKHDRKMQEEAKEVIQEVNRELERYRDELFADMKADKQDAPDITPLKYAYNAIRDAIDLYDPIEP